MKRCPKCGELKDESKFYKDQRSKDGLKNICKKCFNVYNTNLIKQKCEKDEEYKLKLLEYERERQKKRRKKMIEQGLDPDLNSRNSRSRIFHLRTCAIIKKHHDEMQYDPERLPTGFIQKLIGIDCKKK